MSAPINRVPTTNGIGRKPIESTASISSEMRIAPISAVMRVPACDMKAIPATMGPRMRTAPIPPMMPASDPNPRMFRIANASMASEAPVATPRISRTLIVPPSTISDPRPHAMLSVAANVCR